MRENPIFILLSLRIYLHIYLYTVSYETLTENGIPIIHLTLEIQVFAILTIS